MNPNFETVALAGIWLSILGVLLSRRPLWILVALSLAFAFSAMFLFEFWNLKLTASYLISGWMAASMLAVTLLTKRRGNISEEDDSTFFMIIFAILANILIFVAYPLLNSWFISASSRLLISALSSIAVGGIMVSLSRQTLKVLSGYLFILIGFILFYSQLENSALVVSLLSALLLTFSLIGSYLLANEEEELN